MNTIEYFNKEDVNLKAEVLIIATKEFFDIDYIYTLTKTMMLYECPIKIKSIITINNTSFKIKDISVEVINKLDSIDNKMCLGFEKQFNSDDIVYLFKVEYLDNFKNML